MVHGDQLLPNQEWPGEFKPRTGILMHPIGTGIVVDPLYDPEKVETGLSPGAPGLFMPDSAKNPMSQQGVVVAVGPEQRTICVGDHVLYHPFIQHPFKVNGHEYLHVKPRHIVGWLSPSGDLLPLPWDVVVRPDFRLAGRPGREGHLWVPKQVFDIDIPCTGIVKAIGEGVASVEVGQRVLFPPEVGAEVGLKVVWYTLHERDILAIVETEVEVKVTVTPAEWQIQQGGRGA